MLGFSNAKINLGLNIIEKRPDGFHNIESVFYPIPWADILEVIPSENFAFNSSGLAIPGDQKNNLIIKAYHLLRSEGLIPTSKDVQIYLHKILPMGAGIGGGSSNGAFVLQLINDVLQLELSTVQLESFAGKLGSDCPFFIQNKPRYCFGRGTEFENINLSLKGKFLIVVNPDLHISTQEAYAGITPRKPDLSVREIIKKPILEWKMLLVNDFEASVNEKYPVIQNIKETMYQQGALYASMTGSGSTVYGIWENEQDLRHLFSNFIYWSGQLN